MKDKLLIWDLPLRLFHWAFSVTIIGCWATNELGSEYIDLHMTLGYVAMGLVLFRVLWGLVGTKHSRFASFIPTPAKIANYLKRGQVESAGHNPLGSLMVFAMLILVLLQAGSGLFVDDEIFTTGPYFNALGGDIDKLMATIHHNAFDFIMIAIALHIAAVVFYQWGKRQDIIKPMITGYKTRDAVEQGQEITSSRMILAIILALLAAGFVYWLVVINAPVVEEYY